MSRESKILTAGILNTQETISHYESFGWELLSLNGSQITMSRETQNPVYADLVKHQAKYEDLETEYNSICDPLRPEKPAGFEFSTCLLLLILAVVPGLLYIAYKIYKNKIYQEAFASYNAKVNEIKKKRESILSEMKQVALDSRAIFFGKQN
jgi:hypothetical protein